MVKSKAKPQLLTASPGANGKNSDENFPRKSTQSVDHWAFLDEIEAPMWVDLALECDPGYLECDDDWFHRSHPVHQYSSRELTSTFSQSGVFYANSESGLQGLSSPKLPLSVSRSRGTHCKSLELGQGSRMIMSNKLHMVKGLSSKSSLVSSRSKKAVKDKPCDGKLKGHVNSQSSIVGESSLTETSPRAHREPFTGLCSQETVVHFSDFNRGENNSSGTITSGTTGQQSLETCNQIFGNTSGLLTALRVSLRKSCVTRQALRVEVKDKIQTGDRTSSSGKSSVGSSSNPCSDRKSLTVRQHKERTPDSRNLMSMYQAPTYKVNGSNVNRAQSVQAGVIVCKSKRAINKEATKAEVLVPRTVNEEALQMAANAKKTEHADHCKRADAGRKENATGRLALGMISSRREKKAELAVPNEKVIKMRHQKRSCAQNLVGLKVKSSGPSTVKKSANMAEKKTYFR